MKGLILYRGITAPCLILATAGTAPGRAAAQTAAEWRLVQELRIGSEGEGPDGFSDIRGIVVDRKGNLWVLEFSTQDIRVFDPSGKYLRTIGRKGKGPGEFTYADGMALAPDGFVWVHDPQNGRFSIFDEEGRFVRQRLAMSNGYGFMWTGGIDGRGRIWDRVFIPGRGDPRIAVTTMRRISPDWSRTDTLTIPQCRDPARKPEDGIFRIERRSAAATVAIPFFPSPVVAMDYRGQAMWCAPTGAEYRVLKIGFERGDTLVQLTGRGDHLPVTEKERDAAIERIKKSLARLGEISADWSRIPKVKPLLESAFVDEDGRLWVERSTSGSGSARFDIYSPDGRALATLVVPLPLASFRRPLVRGTMAWFIAQEEGEVPYVVRGRISPAP